MADVLSETLTSRILTQGLTESQRSTGRYRVRIMVREESRGTYTCQHRPSSLQDQRQ
jgi:hypothetical protein